MLRNLLIALAAANLLFFAWSHWADKPARPAAGPPAQDGSAAAASKPTTGAVTAAAAPDAAADPANPTGGATGSAVPGPAVCTSLGPFADGIAADRAAALLAGAGMASRPRGKPTPQPDGYWVYVGGLRDADEQRRTLAALKRAGIDDSFAMPDDAKFRVSVGIFNARDRAEQRARRIRGLALDPRIEEHFKLQATQWLDFADVASTALQAPQLAALGINDAALTTTACPL